VEEAPKSFKDQYNDMMSEAQDHLTKILECETLKEHYKIPTRTIDGKTYVYSLLT